MCFDKYTLSAFVDGELSEGQIKNIESHIEECSRCRGIVESFTDLKIGVQFSREEVSSFVKENIWTRISYTTTTCSKLGFWHRGFFLTPGVMVTLSFIFITVIGIGFFFLSQTKLNNAYYISNSEETFNPESFHVDIPVDSVEKALSYFNIHDEPLEVVIQLPDSSSFKIQGEPRFLLKTNYIAGR